MDEPLNGTVDAVKRVDHNKRNIWPCNAGTFKPGEEFKIVSGMDRKTVRGYCRVEEVKGDVVVMSDPLPPGTVADDLVVLCEPVGDDFHNLKRR